MATSRAKNFDLGRFFATGTEVDFADMRFYSLLAIKHAQHEVIHGVTDGGPRKEEKDGGLRRREIRSDALLFFCDGRYETMRDAFSLGNEYPTGVGLAIATMAAFIKEGKYRVSGKYFDTRLVPVFKHDESYVMWGFAKGVLVEQQKPWWHLDKVLQKELGIPERKGSDIAKARRRDRRHELARERNAAGKKCPECGASEWVSSGCAPCRRKYKREFRKKQAAQVQKKDGER